jgi:hypothetical protein
VWYQYTAPQDGTIVADTLGSNYDTVLSVYAGSCAALTPVNWACNDNASYMTAQSQLTVAAVAGRTYYFMISAPYFGGGGTATFHLALNGSTQPITATPTLIPTKTPTPIAVATATPITPAVAPTATATQPPVPTATVAAGTANDACPSAVVISTAPYTATMDTTTATTAVTDPYPSCNYWARNKTVWYQYTAPRYGTIVADTLGGNYDTVLSVYAGSPAALRPVNGACNDNASYMTAQSQVMFTVSAGTTYYFMISAPYFGSGGMATFHLSLY